MGFCLALPLLRLHNVIGQARARSTAQAPWLHQLSVGVSSAALAIGAVGFVDHSAWSQSFLLAQSGLGRPAVPMGQPTASPASTSGARAITPTTGLVTIESDLQQADNGTGVVTATGNVRIVYPDQRVVATARQAQYFTKEGRVVLSGDVDVIQEDGHAVRAERVTYFVNQERLIAQPPTGEQVLTRYRLNAPQPKSAVPAKP